MHINGYFKVSIMMKMIGGENGGMIAGVVLGIAIFLALCLGIYGGWTFGMKHFS